MNILNDEKRKLILIVDDIPDNLRVLGNIIKEEGYKIAIASNGRQALTIVNSILPDLILLDVSMPEMDGLEVCRRIKDDPKIADIPVIFLTARTDSEDVLKGFEAGGVDYIPKPFKQKELLARIRTQLEIRSNRTKLLEDAKQLKELIATKDKFFSIIAHDLKSPFHALLGLSEVLKEDMDVLSKDEMKKYANMIYNSAAEAFKLLENLLNWSRMQTGKMEYNPFRYEVIHSVTSAVSLLTGTAESKGIQLSHSVEGGVFVHADKNMIDTVVRNIVSNSIKFSMPGNYVKVSSSMLNENVLIKIEDNGIGMKEEVKNNLFALDKGHSSLGTQNERGTGLGLILCRDMIEMHKGKIWVDSEPGKGTTVYFTLPVA